MKLFRLALTTPPVGRKAPLVQAFIVMAPDEAGVLPAFDRDRGAHQREGDLVQISPWDGAVAPLKT